MIKLVLSINAKITPSVDHIDLDVDGKLERCQILLFAWGSNCFTLCDRLQPQLRIRSTKCLVFSICTMHSHPTEIWTIVQPQGKSRNPSFACFFLSNCALKEPA
jgi:hypothetical protein